MSFVTYLAEAEVRDNKDTITGKIFSRPAMSYTDGINVTYACDVDVGQEGPINDNGDIGIVPLRNVPIAANNKSLVYAEVGQAVTLRKDSSGRWEVSGLSKTLPGTFTLVPVTISQPCHTFPILEHASQVSPTTVIVGDPTQIGIEARLLTYGEVSSLGVYGVTPYGAIGVFENGSLIEIRSS
jgi:hypothetical protein